ncbi:MAG: glycosyltransferase [Patescibacteria group bacterium]
MLSIIIPTLNEEDYLSGLLESIKRQTFKDYEIIIADANSTDTTLKIAKSYGCRITKGGLPAKGRNEGAKVAKGDILLFLDADVIISHEKFIENSLAEFKRKNLDIAIFPLAIVKGKKIDKIAVTIWNKWISLMQKVFPHGASAFLVKKRIHESINGFDESIVFAEDQHYADRAGKISKLGVVEKEPVCISIRRYEKDGRFNTYIKYVIADMHILFKGPIRSEIFSYRFNHYKDEKIENRK